MLEGHLATSPAKTIRLVPEPDDELGIFTHEQLTALLALPDRRTWTGFRDHAIMAILYDTGLRLSKLTGLRLEDVLWSRAAAAGVGERRRPRKERAQGPVWR